MENDRYGISFSAFQHKQRAQELLFLTDRLLVGEPPRVWQRVDQLLKLGVSEESIREALQVRKRLTQPRMPSDPEPVCPHSGEKELHRCGFCCAVFCESCFSLHDILFHEEVFHET